MKERRAAPAWLAGCALAASMAAHAEPITLIGSGAHAQDARGALAARGESVAIARDGDAAAPLEDDARTLVATDAASCASLSRARSPRRACALVKAQDVPPRISAVTAEVAFDAQLSLIARALPGRTRVLVLRAPGDAVRDAALVHAAQQAGLSLTLVDVRAPGEAVPALLSALRQPGVAPVLLALPDRAVFTADTVAPLAQAAMSARVPLVGFSPYFLRIGAVAALRPDVGAAALRALALARADGAPTAVEPSAAGVLEVDGRLAARLGIPVRAGDGVEVRR